MNKKYGDPNKEPASGASNSNLPNILYTVQEDQKRFYDFSRVIWSSGRVMSYMIGSQMTNTKLHMNQFKAKFKSMPRSISEHLLNFLPPFYHSAKVNNLKINVVEANLIPNWITTDW